MKKLTAFIFALAFALNCEATNYYGATAAGGGSDANNGLTTGTPWLSPNHALNCGDTITFAASTAYAASNFGSSKWGTVTCAAGNNVAWVQCATFDGCKITTTANWGMWITANYWGVQGWEVAETGNNGLCFGVSPTGGVTIHHIILANNICNGGASGFSASSASSTVSFDYVAVLGNIAWNATQSTVLCNSGVTLYEPIKSDSLPGTHIYVAGNFSFDNASPTNCNSGSSTYDGNGIVFDDFSNAQSGGAAYAQQAVIDNNLAVWNGGYGISLSGNGTQNSLIHIRQNTSVHNLIATNSSATTCGDITILGPVSNVQQYGNLIQTAGATACIGSSQTLYAMNANGADVTDKTYGNFLYSASGNNTGSVSSTGYVYGPNNTTGTDPLFASIADPGQPSCSGKASTVDCMATVIANYTPATAAAKAYGYQIPSTTSRYDPIYPQWLCSVTNMPAGLVTPGCVVAGQLSSVR